jgi:hypothetical protein
VEKNRVGIIAGSLGALSLILAGVWIAGRLGADRDGRRILAGELTRLESSLRGLGNELAKDEKARRESVVQLAGAVEKLDGGIATCEATLELTRANREDIDRLIGELSETRNALDGIAERLVRDPERLERSIGEVTEIGKIGSENEELARRGRQRVRELAEELGIELEEKGH